MKDISASDRMTSIFRWYYSDALFVDRYLKDKSESVDVVIPVIHTNELWEANLKCLYREIPVNRLLIGDGGCIDDSLDIARKFPRVKICDHREYKSLGYSIRKLIEEVETDWFIYPHSDVYLPAGWFDVMKKYKGKYDWYGCKMQHTVMVEYPGDYDERPWAGAQMGRKQAFETGLSKIDDDYVYRQEDFIWREIVRRGGFREGFVDETFHYHQTMYKPTPWHRKVNHVQLTLDMSREEEIRTWDMQVRGIIKYLQPDSKWLISNVDNGISRLIELHEFKWKEFQRWVKTTNEAWCPYVARRRFIRRCIGFFLRSIFKMVFQ